MHSEVLKVERAVLVWRNKGDSFRVGPISFNVGQGEIVGVFGRSGTGKSTFLRSLLGELELTEGKIHIPTDFSVYYHDQNQKLVPWLTAYKNAQINCDESTDLNFLKRILNLCGMDEFGSLNATELSGGQRARVAIARTLIEDGDIVLFDEPFNGIDVRGQELLVEEIKKSVGNKIIFLSSHDPGLLMQLCSKIVYFVDDVTIKKKDNSRGSKAFVFKVEAELLKLLPAERMRHKKYKSEIQRLARVLYD